MKNIRENVKINKENYVKNIKHLDLDVIEDIFKRGVLEGVKHSTPSPETSDRLNRIETTLENITSLFATHSKGEADKLDNFITEFREGMKDVKVIVDILEHGSFMAKVGKWGFGSLVTLGGAYLLFKDIFHGQN